MAEDVENLFGQDDEDDETDNVVEEAENEPADGEVEASVDGDTPAPEVSDRLAALEAQLTRANEDRETLRETLRLNQQLVEQSRSQQHTKKTLTDDQKALKDLGLAFGDDIQESIAPLTNTVTRLYDQNDAVQFQLELQREAPELLGAEFNKVSAVVNDIRQRAAQNGMALGRMDAYRYAKGAGLLSVMTSADRSTDANELRRQSEVKAASGARSSEKKSSGASGAAADIQSIREKAQRGERLSPQERSKFRAYLGNQAF